MGQFGDGQALLHAISHAEAFELIQRRFIDRLAWHARDFPTAMAQPHRRSSPGSPEPTSTPLLSSTLRLRTRLPGSRRSWSRPVRSLYTAGPVSPTTVNWVDLLAQPPLQLPALADPDGQEPRDPRRPPTGAAV